MAHNPLMRIFLHAEMSPYNANMSQYFYHLTKCPNYPNDNLAPVTVHNNGVLSVTFTGGVVIALQWCSRQHIPGRTAGRHQRKGVSARFL